MAVAAEYKGQFTNGVTLRGVRVIWRFVTRGREKTNMWWHKLLSYANEGFAPIQKKAWMASQGLTIFIICVLSLPHLQPNGDLRRVPHQHDFTGPYTLSWPFHLGSSAEPCMCMRLHSCGKKWGVTNYSRMNKEVQHSAELYCSGNNLIPSQTRQNKLNISNRPYWLHHWTLLILCWQERDKESLFRIVKQTAVLLHKATFEK